MDTRNKMIVSRRRQGRTLTDIGHEFGLTAGRVSQIITQELARATEDVDILRQLEADRLDELFYTVWQDALLGDGGSQERVLRIMDRRAKLFGLDHSDKLEQERLKLEVEKVRLMAVAFGKAMDEIGLTAEQRQRAAEVMVAELRQYVPGEEDLIG